MTTAPRLGSVLLRHFSAYAGLLRADLGDALDAWQRRVAAAVALALVVVAAVVVASLSVLLLTWWTPYRVAAVITIAALYALGAALAGWYFVRCRTQTAPLFEHAAAEWAADRLLLEEALRRLSQDRSH